MSDQQSQTRIFTDAQRQAIDRREGELLLAAGAGSGKTSVMVERFVLGVIQDGLKPEEILTITFTEAAATELKVRVAQRFEQLNRNDLAHGSSSAYISTVHGLCARLLRSEAIDAGLDPNYGMLDTNEAQLLQGRAFNLALRELAEAEHRPVISLLANYGRANLKQSVITTYDQLRGYGHTDPKLPQIPPLEPLDQLLQRFKQARVQLLSLLEAETRSSKKNLLATEILERAEPLMSQLTDEWPEAVLKALEIPGRVSNALKSIEAERYRELLASVRKFHVDTAALADYGLISQLFDRFHHHYSESKKASSQLDFNDLELKARDLLANNDHLRERYQKQFKAVMVDEFQDTNPLQVEIVELLSCGSRFFVGDEQQSIYGFRGADIEVFRSMRGRLEGRGSLLSLQQNFRSNSQILHSVNSSFAKLFEDGYMPLKAGSDKQLIGAEQTQIELIVVPQTPVEDLPDQPHWREVEAEQLALRIAELVRSQRFRAGEIVVLLRALTNASIYQQALVRQGLDTYLSGGSGFWQSVAVRQLLAYLAVLANPLDQVALYTVLRSPLVDMSLDGLYLLAQLSRSENLEPYDQLQGIVNGVDVWPGSNEDSAAIERFDRLFSSHRELTVGTTLAGLSERIVVDSEFEFALLKHSYGRRELANIRKLIRFISAYEYRHGSDIRGLLDQITELTNDQGAAAREGEAQVIGGDLDAVRIMTIHRSKGLEFPVVALADMGRDSKAIQRSNLLVSREGSVGFKLRRFDRKESYDAFDYGDISQRLKAADKEQERRLFYVAMTRAQQQLLLSGAVDIAKSGDEIKPAESPMAWLGTALVPDLVERLAVGGCDELIELSSGEHPLAVRLLHQTEPAEIQPPLVTEPAIGERQEELSALADPAASRGPYLPASRSLSYSALALYQSCRYRFYLQHLLRLPQELAEVSNLGVAATNSDTPHSGLAALDRGRLAHRLAELIDFKADYHTNLGYLKRELQSDDLTLEGTKLELGEAEVEEFLKLFDRFLNSDLYQQIASLQRHRSEYRFGFLLNKETLFEGAVDLYAESGADSVLIMDYKTDSLKGRDPAALVSDNYLLQRTIYALAALQNGAAKVEVVYCFLESPQLPISSIYRQEDVTRLQSSLSEQLEGITGSEFTPTSSPNRRTCSGCPGLGTYCSWPVERCLSS